MLSVAQVCQQYIIWKNRWVGGTGGVSVTLLEFDGFIKYHTHSCFMTSSFDAYITHEFGPLPPASLWDFSEIGPLLLHLSLWDFRSCPSFVSAAMTHALTRSSLEKRGFSWLTVQK